MEDETDERDESVDDFDAIDQQEIKLTKKPGFSQQLGLLLLKNFKINW